MTYAFEQARARDHEPYVLHTTPPATLAADAEAIRANIAEVLAGWAQTSPDVRVIRAFVVDGAEQAIVAPMRTDLGPIEGGLTALTGEAPTGNAEGKAPPNRGVSMTATFTANHAQVTPVTGERTAPVSLVLGVIRLAMGWTFLWPFLDKAFGLGHETASADAWVNGGSPTSGFLGHATKGPFSDTYQSFAGHAWVDWLFMLGLLGIGTALILGVAVRMAAAAGALLLVLMWTAVLPPENNIFLDDHLIYALVLAVLALASAGRTFGLGNVWEKLPIVRKNPVLR